VRIAREAAGKVFADPANITDNRTIASEDFSEFSERVPGVFIFLGAGNEAKGADLPHHNPRFDIDESVLPHGVELYVKGALQYFKQAEAGKTETR